MWKRMLMTNLDIFWKRTSSVWWLITASFERVAKLARESTAFKNVEKFQLSTFRQKLQPSQYFKTRTNVAMKNIFRLEPSVCISFQRAAPPWHGDESGAETIFCKNHKRIQPLPIFQTYTWSQYSILLSDRRPIIAWPCQKPSKGFIQKSYRIFAGFQSKINSPTS